MEGAWMMWDDSSREGRGGRIIPRRQRFDEDGVKIEAEETLSV